MTQEKYEQRITAFADILGWGVVSKKKSEFKRLLKIANSIKDYADKFSQQQKAVIEGVPEVTSQFKTQYSSIEFSFFSDSFAISALIDQGKNVFRILKFASDILLREKFLVRGGVTIGDLLHRKRMIYGPALVEAVEMEKHEAMYPRFLCSYKLVAHLESMGYKDEVILQDFPQSWVVNIALESEIVCDEHMAIIESVLSNSKISEKIMRKWRYTYEMLPKMYEQRKSTL